MYARRRYRKPNTRSSRYGRSYGTRYSRKGYNAQARSKAMVVTTTRTSNSANRVGGNGLDKISTGRFRNLPTLWPDRFMCKMKYLDTVNTTLSIPQSGYTAITNYRVNSLWDPLLSTAAEQNLAGYQELQNMYSYYRVHAAKITANVVPNTNNSTGCLVYCGFSPQAIQLTSASSYTAVLNSIGNPYVVWAMGSANSAQPINLENYVGMKKLAGSVVADTDNDYASAVNTNPARTLYGTVAVSIPVANPSATALAFTSIVEIEFWAEFYGRDYEYV